MLLVHYRIRPVPRHQQITIAPNLFLPNLTPINVRQVARPYVSSRVNAAAARTSVLVLHHRHLMGGEYQPSTWEASLQQLPADAVAVSVFELAGEWLWT
jgi:hypothetical protein